MAQQTIQIADKPTLDEIKELLENTTYGLAALKAYVDENETYLKNSTYGLNAIKSLLDSKANESTLNTKSADILWLLQNTDFGLSVIRQCLGDLLFLLQNETYGLNTIKNQLNTVESHSFTALQQINTALAYNQPRYVFVNFYNVNNEYANSNTFTYNFTGRGKIKIYSNFYSETFNVNLVIDGVSTPFILQNYSGGGKNGVFLEFEYNTSLSITFTTSSSGSVQLWQYNYIHAV